MFMFLKLTHSKTNKMGNNAKLRGYGTPQTNHPGNAASFPRNPDGTIKGKPHGSKDKRKLRVLKQVEYVLNLLTPKLAEDIEKLTPLQRVSLWFDLQEYIRPKLARNTIAGDPDNPIESKRTIVLHAHGSPRPEELAEKAKLGEFKEEASVRISPAIEAELTGDTSSAIPETSYEEI
jgi:hypothetical protein